MRNNFKGWNNDSNFDQKPWLLKRGSTGIRPIDFVSLPASVFVLGFILKDGLHLTPFGLLAPLCAIYNLYNTFFSKD